MGLGRRINGCKREGIQRSSVVMSWVFVQKRTWISPLFLWLALNVQLIKEMAVCSLLCGKCCFVLKAISFYEVFFAANLAITF